MRGGRGAVQAVGGARRQKGGYEAGGGAANRSVGWNKASTGPCKLGRGAHRLEERCKSGWGGATNRGRGGAANRG